MSDLAGNDGLNLRSQGISTRPVPHPGRPRPRIPENFIAISKYIFSNNRKDNIFLKYLLAKMKRYFCWHISCRKKNIFSPRFAIIYFKNILSDLK